MPSTKPAGFCCERIFVGLFLAASFANAGELVYFKNGFTLAAISHLQQGDTVEVHVGSGTMSFPLGEVEKIEALPAGEIPGDPPKILTATVAPEDTLNHAALTQGIDAAFVRSVAVVESGLKQNRISVRGAVGLMQLMPATAKELGVDATQAEQNARGGVQYLRTLLLRYQGDSVLALAAYNAGPGAVGKYRGVPPFRETRQYVLSVLKEYKRQLRLVQTESKQLASAKVASKPSAID